MEITRTGAHREITRRHRFQIVVEDIGFRRHHDFERAFLAQEIRRQDLDGRGRTARANRANGLREMRSTAIGEVVPIHRGDDDMGKPSLKVASATCSGSSASSAPGMPVLTLQKAQARVQVSPMIMKVACFLSQHSPMFGQPASSHTVTRPFSLTILRVSA